MHARVWGSRGSVAAPGADTVRYGGNTSCVEVRLDSEHLLILDAGTGIRALGARVQEEMHHEIHILLTHLHMDHLQGLGFFRPLFRPGVELHIWGPPSPVSSLESRIATYLSPPLFPVHLSDVGAKVTFHDATPEVTIGSATVRAANVTHQGPTVGYRIEEDGKALAYLPDHEPALGVDLDELPPAWISGHELAHGVDVLLHDAQYGDHEYPRHVGWGHSSIGHVTSFARKSRVERLVLFHHDPYHTDDELETLLDVARRQWMDNGDRIHLAHEGMTIALDTAGVRLKN